MLCGIKLLFQGEFLMTIYHKPVRLLMYDMVKELLITPKQMFSKEDAIEWFEVNYPLINKNTVKCHLIKLSTNAPNRLHFNVIPYEDDLFYRIDANHFRLFEKNTDPAPIWYDKSEYKQIVENPLETYDPITRLKEVGFKPVGQWVIKNDSIFPEISDFNDEKDVLYAFIVFNEIKYIGKTSRLLKQRLKKYIKPSKTQRTNIRNNQHIHKTLLSGNAIIIYALKNNNKEYKGFKLSLPAALEDSMIQTFQPEWNVRR